MLTSYFAKSNEFAGMRLVSIARGTPDWFTGERLEILTPTWELINTAKGGYFNSYVETYKNEYLSKISCSFINRFYKDAVFFCWEAFPPGGLTVDNFYTKKYFCHRHLFSKHMRNAGFDCREAIRL